MAEQSRRVAAQEARFVEAFMTTGDLVGSAQKAGYSRPRETAAKLMRRSDVVSAIRVATLARLHTEGAWIAANALLSIAGDETAPKNPRVAAAKTISEIIGFNSVQDALVDKPLSEMTRAELSAAKDRALAYLRELDAPVIEGEAVAVQDEDDEPAGGLFD